MTKQELEQMKRLRNLFTLHILRFKKPSKNCRAELSEMAEIIGGLINKKRVKNK